MMTPEEAVKAAVDSAALEGVVLDEEFQAALLLVAQDELVAQLAEGEVQCG